MISEPFWMRTTPSLGLKKMVLPLFPPISSASSGILSFFKAAFADSAFLGPMLSVSLQEKENICAPPAIFALRLERLAPMSTISSTMRNVAESAYFEALTLSLPSSSL